MEYAHELKGWSTWWSALLCCFQVARLAYFQSALSDHVAAAVLSIERR